MMIAFDANGNTTTKTDSSGTTNYSWDFDNRLASFTLPGRVAHPLGGWRRLALAK